MNYLGHFYLSQDDEELIIGNFIADHIKGKEYLQYPPGISKGIIMHRNIDTYTDQHSLVKRSKRRLFGKYRHYSAVIIDMYYDHFLAANWNNYSTLDLSLFALNIYNVIESHWDLLPDHSQYLFSYMKKGNWLVRYKTTEGLDRSLKGMAQRTKFKSDMENAIDDLQEHYQEYLEEFKMFIEDVKNEFS